ncbi:MAG: nitroreductase family protein [Oscillospiraceae bacterium]|nr:nitroreductase family protein [Oscillospiraceae bacterium]
MTFMELAKSRYSVRGFSDAPVEEEKLAAILEAGRIAPTACNNQPQHIYVAKSADAIAKLRTISPCTYNSNLILIVCYDTAVQAAHFGEQDASIVCTHMMLEAWEQGVGSCWVGMFNAEELVKAFDLPENIRPIALLPLGYAAEGVQPAPLHTAYRDYAATITEL